MRKPILAVALSAVAALAAAQEFPAKPVRIVVPNPAGGTVDIVSRALAQPMAAALGQNVLVDIRPGSLAMYYPEANVLVPRRLDARSQTPAFKSVPARVLRVMPS